MGQKKQAVNAEHPDVAALKALTTATAGYESFAELAATTLARSFLRKKRPRDAQRVLASYLLKHPSSAKIAEVLAELA